MAFHRVRKDRNFTVMSNHHLQSKVLSLKAKGLMSQILSYPDDWCFSVRGLAAISKESPDGIRTAIRELEQQGYLIRRLRKEENRFAGAEYDIYEIPLNEASAADYMAAPGISSEPGSVSELHGNAGDGIPDDGIPVEGVSVNGDGFTNKYVENNYVTTTTELINTNEQVTAPSAFEELMALRKRLRETKGPRHS